MPSTLNPAVGLDSSLVAGQAGQPRIFAGYFVTPTKSIREAIVRLREGDFNLVHQMAQSISPESRDRFTILIRASGSRTPVISITDSPKGCDSFADLAVGTEPHILLKSIREFMAKRAGASAPNRDMQAIAV